MSSDEIISRLKAHWMLKVVFGLGLMVMFALIYHLPQRFPVFPVTAMPTLWIDRMIPFRPNSIYLYESLSLFMPIAPWLMKTRIEINQYSKGLILMNLVGFLFFFLYPTSSPRPADLHGANALYLQLIRIDNELNAFPSLHAAYAVFHGACCHVIFRAGVRSILLRLGCWSWALGILVSTLLTKQHVFVDVIAGSLLGLGSFALFCWPTRISWLQRKSI